MNIAITSRDDTLVLVYLDSPAIKYFTQAFRDATASTEQVVYKTKVTLWWKRGKQSHIPPPPSAVAEVIGVVEEFVMRTQQAISRMN
jgi:hypothetical protein